MTLGKQSDIYATRSKLCKTGRSRVSPQSKGAAYHYMVKFLVNPNVSDVKTDAHRRSLHISIAQMYNFNEAIANAVARSGRSEGRPRHDARWGNNPLGVPPTCSFSAYYTKICIFIVRTTAGIADGTDGIL
jgi:hypothetical protein